MMVEAACRSIEGAAGRIGLDALAAEAKMSPSHFHRTFRAILGITPKQYEIKIRRDRARDNLADGSITTAIYKSGYSSSSRFYESTDQWLGMKPSVYRRGAQEQKIRYAIGTCSLGSLLVATSEKGICSISLGGSTTKLLRALRNTFPNADVTPGDKETKQTLVQVISLVESPTSNHSLPLDICGTAFQQRVWLALQKIPAGTTLSYQELASRIGRPNSARAVANACAANKLAVAIPCHRIVRNDGTLSGYRWGADRKRKLLELEANQSSR
jgi:AraC family transcriptional regulator of adaptative response/methylated-DNA-[protein]-cysteine methyltransferase